MTPQKRAVEDLLKTAPRSEVRGFAERLGFTVFNQEELNRNRAQNIACLLLLTFPALVYRAWVASKIYHWFAPPDWVHLPFGAFVGLTLIGWLTIPAGKSGNEPVDLSWTILSLTIGPTFCLLVGSLLSMVV